MIALGVDERKCLASNTLRTVTIGLNPAAAPEVSKFSQPGPLLLGKPASSDLDLLNRFIQIQLTRKVA